MLVWHVHLVFATYAAIVDNHPGVRSVLISIGVTRKRWLMVAAAFVGSVLIEAPIAAPLYFLILKIANPLVAEGFTWMLVMLMRPIFIATLHEIYEDFRPDPSAPQLRRKRMSRRALSRRLGIRTELALLSLSGKLFHAQTGKAGVRATLPRRLFTLSSGQTLAPGSHAGQGQIKTEARRAWVRVNSSINK
jgi:hypothetical protein